MVRLLANLSRVSAVFLIALLAAPAWAVTATIGSDPAQCNAANDAQFEPAIDAALLDPLIDRIEFNCGNATQRFATTKLIDRTLMIDGDNPNGAANMTIARQATGVQPRRLFTVDPAGNLTLKDITHTGGDASGGAAPDNQGAVVFNSGALSLIRATLTGTATAEGGAIFNDGSLTITGSVLTGNTALSGGGIFNTPLGSVTISGSAFTTNASTAAGSGAALHNAGGVATVIKSTILGSTAPITGASVVNGLGALAEAGQTTLANVTVSTATAAGVVTTGIGASLSVINSTLAPTLAASSAAVSNFQAALDLNNTILIAPGPDCIASNSGTISAAGLNVASDTTCATAVGTNNNFLGIGGAAAPMLGAAASALNADNVAQTFLPLMAGSPALDKGDANFCNSGLINRVDQLARTRFQDGDGNGTLVCDIGSSEVPGVDGDADGVSSALEGAVPTRDASGNVIVPLAFGDGNGDGVLDSMQATVASLPAADNASFITVQAVSGGALSLVGLSADMPTGTPAGFNFPFGLLRFTTATSPANVVITFPGFVNAYFKYTDVIVAGQPTPLGFSRADGQVNAIAGITVANTGSKVALNLVTGTYGDTDASAVTITDPGAAAGSISGSSGGPPVPGGGGVVVIEEDDDDSGCTITRGGTGYELLVLAMFAAFGVWYTRRRGLV